MSASVADLYVVLDSITDPFSAGMKKAAADAEAQSKRMSSALGTVTKVGLGLSVAVGGIAAASVKAASDFQTSMTKLYTAAGASKQAVLANQKAVLDLGTQTGYTGTQMAQALYLPVSAGFQMADALNIVKYAAEEAQISGANLTDTAYSLSSVMKAFNYPANQAGQAMSDLNAIVGDGAMTFQDFNASVKNWAPTADTLGISLNSMGSALAYLTDRGNSAEEASTRLTMGLAMMVTPSKQAATLLEGMGVASSDVSAATGAMTEVLKKTGITQNRLAADLRKPDGIYVALNDLQTALGKAGIKGTEADSVISKIFGGGRSDKAILSLLGNLDGLHQKFDQITGDSTMSKFQANWDDTRKNFSFLMDQMKAGAQNLGIELGLHLIPELSKFITTAEGAGSQVVAGFTGSASKPPTHPGMGNALLNRDMTTAPSLTGWQEFGQKVHQYLTDIETDAKKLEPIGQDLVRFGTDVYQGGAKLLSGLEPTAKLLGGAMLLALTETGHVLADVVGPAFKWFGDFVDSHKTLFEVFAVGVLGTMAAKMTIIGGINAARSIVELATSIAQFPLLQADQIGGALGALKTAYTGKDAAEGEQAIVGLKGALTDLKGAASGTLDKILPDSGKLAGLAKVGQDIGGIEKAAADAEQLSLFETNLNGIVQVAGHEQLALFATDIESVGSAAGKAEGAASGLLGKLGKFVMPVAIVAGIGMIGYELGKALGVGRSLAPDIDQLATAMTQAADGSAAAKRQINALVQVITTAPFHTGAASMGDLDKALTQLVTSGHAQEAKDEFNQIAQALAKQGIDAQGAASKFPGYEAALKAAGDAAQTMGGKVQGAIDAMQHQQGLDQFTTDVNTLTQSIKDNGGALAGNSDQAKQNVQAFRNAALESLQFYQGQVNAHAPMDQVNRDLTSQYNQLEQVGIQFLGSKKKADDFLTSLGMIKPDYSTTLTVNVDTTQIIRAQDMLNSFGGGSASRFGFADGGFVPGSKGAPRLAVVHGGEYVVSNAMQTGRAPIDPRILSGAGGGGGSAGYVPGFGHGGTTVINNYYNANFAGSLMTEDEALRKLRTAQLQWSTHNGGSGWSVP